LVGWICYAEKTHGYILPHISQVKSPQQVMGTLVKHLLPQHLGLELQPSQIYHVSIMPCYDKKLEASRIQFQDDKGVRDVDCVLTTIEIESMLQSKGLNWTDLTLTYDKASLLFTKGLETPQGLELIGTPGSSSGGYLSFIFRVASKELFGLEVSLQDIDLGQNHVKRVLKQGRNKSTDFVQILLVHPDTEQVLLRFAYAYGFKNIQNVVRKIKTSNKSSGMVDDSRAVSRVSSNADMYDYVELMACPSGCINGGGQLKAPIDIDGKEWISQSENAYHYQSARKFVTDSPEQNESAMRIYHEMSKSDQDRRLLLYTTYQAVEKNINNSLGVKW
jgi:iron only hydrogenase large subunit-like protein